MATILLLIVSNKSTMTSSISSFYLKKAKIQNRDKQESIKPIKVAIYRRVSTQEQANDGQSMDAQKERIFKFLNNDISFENKKTEITDYSDNGFSGKNMNRPAIKELLKKLNDKEIDYVIVIKLDRLSRHLPEMYKFMELVNKLDVGFISISEKIDTKTAHGRFFIGILASLSQLEREQTAERVQGVFKELVTKQPVGGKAPFGYVYYKEDDNSVGKYVPYLEEEAKAINLPPLKLNVDQIIYPGVFLPLIFKWYSEYKNFRRIALNLTELQIPTSTQIQQTVNHYFNSSKLEEKHLTYLTVLNSKKWNPRSVKDILCNPFYTGTRVWNRKDNLNKKIRNYDEWIFVNDAHAPLISNEMFQTTVEMIQG